MNELLAESLGVRATAEEISNSETLEALRSRFPADAVYTSSDDQPHSTGEGFEWHLGEGWKQASVYVGRIRTLIPGSEYIAVEIHVYCRTLPVQLEAGDTASQTIVTNKGVHLGDDRSEVLKQYGRPHKRYADSSEGSASEERMWYSADGCILQFEIDLESHRVEGMSLLYTRDA